MFRTPFIPAVLILGIGTVADAQRVVRQDSASVRDTRSGTWSATSGTLALMGTWTAAVDTAHNTVTGTWTLMDAERKTVAFGGWAAAKANDQWTGGWRANVTGRPGEYSGAWVSTITVKPTAKFADLFESAIQTIVSGTWSSGANSGAWSIRAAPAK